MDRGTGLATVHGVVKSRPQLSTSALCKPAYRDNNFVTVFTILWQKRVLYVSVETVTILDARSGIRGVCVCVCVLEQWKSMMRQSLGRNMTSRDSLLQIADGRFPWQRRKNPPTGIETDNLLNATLLKWACSFPNLFHMKVTWKVHDTEQSHDVLISRRGSWSIRIEK